MTNAAQVFDWELVVVDQLTERSLLTAIALDRTFLMNKFLLTVPV